VEGDGEEVSFRRRWGGGVLPKEVGRRCPSEGGWEEVSFPLPLCAFPYPSVLSSSLLPSERYGKDSQSVTLLSTGDTGGGGGGGGGREGGGERETSPSLPPPPPPPPPVSTLNYATIVLINSPADPLAHLFASLHKIQQATGV
jgi:hypothetical protein